VKLISNQKGLDTYNQNKLKEEMNELENFASRLENKKLKAGQKPGALVLGNVNTKLAF
jgi:polynucleotide 5'-kinase involved in rRNA processing